jgi:pimeloyl-ACP methyl ester carboxylesterase
VKSIKSVVRPAIALAGVIAAIPLTLLLALLPSTPITLAGTGYLCACTLVVLGAISAPWRQERGRGLMRIGMAILLAIITIRSIIPPASTSLILTSFPAQRGARWLNRIFDEQDIVLFGEQVAARIGGLVSAREHSQLPAALQHAYATMRAEDATGLSPFLSTALDWQQPESFDVFIARPRSPTPPRAGVIFLHGFGGNYAMQCWLFARATLRSGMTTLCPSVGWRGEWWTAQGEATVQRMIHQLQQAGLERIYLAGLSNGALGASRLAPRLSTPLAGLILISGADPDVATTSLPVLIIEGTQDERMPVELTQRYAGNAGANATLRLFDSDHFLLAKRPDEVEEVVTDWLVEQEADNLPQT